MMPHNPAAKNQRDRFRKKRIDYMDKLRASTGKKHAFRIFTRGMDECAICRKPRSEHK
jgi:hypothetical protein